MGELLKNETFALELSNKSGYNCQYITLEKGIEQKLPISVTGVISIGYSPFSYNKVVKIPSATTTIEIIEDSWWGNKLSLRKDEEGDIYLTQNLWDSQRLRITSI